MLCAGLRVEATTGECRVDPVDTVLEGDAYRGSHSIRVANAEGIVARGRYLMARPEGEREWIEVTAVAGTTLSLKHPLIHRYAGAATIVGCRISIAADPAWVSRRDNLSDTGRHRGLAGYMLRWTYTVDGIEMTGVSFADLVTLPSAELVTPQDVDARNPGFIAGLPSEHRANQGADFIAEAFRAVRLEAVGDSHAQRKIRDTRILRELVNARTQVIRLEHEVIHGEKRAEELAIAEKRYRSRYAQLVKQAPTEVEPSDPAKLGRSSSAQVAKGSEPGTPRRIPKLTEH